MRKIVVDEKYNNKNVNNFILDSFPALSMNNLYKAIEQSGKVCNFAPEKLPDLIKRIKSISSAYKVEIQDFDAKYLVECCGTNLQDIINELRKLIEYVGENR